MGSRGSGLKEVGGDQGVGVDRMAIKDRSKVVEI